MEEDQREAKYDLISWFGGERLHFKGLSDVQRELERLQNVLQYKQSLLSLGLVPGEEDDSDM